MLCGVCHFDLYKFLKGKWQKTTNGKLNSRGILFLEGAVMKNIIIALGFFLEGAARIFDFAGALNEEGLHETQDDAAIHKDWAKVGKDYSNPASCFQSKEFNNSREIKNGIKKKKSGGKNIR